jgi:hypothetical protein
MATPKVAAGALLSTVANTATSISTVVNTVNDTISMAHDFVRTAKERQALFNKAQIKNLPTIVKEDIARANVVRRKEIKDWLKTDPELTEMYKLALEEVSNIFDDQQAA